MNRDVGQTIILRKSSELPQYMAYPKFLLTVQVHDTAKLVYVLLLDRARISMKNEGWTDDNGYVFVYFTIENLAEATGKSTMTIKSALRALEQNGLICRKRQGANRPNKIYVLVQTENCPSGETKSKSWTDRKLSSSKNQNKYKELHYVYEEGDSL